MAFSKDERIQATYGHYATGEAYEQYKSGAIGTDEFLSRSRRMLAIRLSGVETRDLLTVAMLFHHGAWNCKWAVPHTAGFSNRIRLGQLSAKLRRREADCYAAHRNRTQNERTGMIAAAFPD